MELNLEAKKDMESQEAMRLLALVKQALAFLKTEEDNLAKNKQYKLAGEKKQAADVLVKKSSALQDIIVSYLFCCYFYLLQTG